MSSHPPGWDRAAEQPLTAAARNVSTRYLSILADMAIGLALLPFNLAHLGASNYGLWVLLGSVTMHFSAFELGNSGAMVKFMAQYRARHDAQAMNEIASTMFIAFGIIGLISYSLLAGVAFNLEHLFTLSAQQAAVGQWILLIIGLHVTLNFPFGVYGGVTSGFQRYDINNVVAVVTSVLAALVNVFVVLSGYSLLTLVASTTAVRLSAYAVYRANAYRVFPQLSVRPSLFRRARLREVMGFSAYTTIIDWATKLNYQLDEVVIGAFLGPAAVAVWAPAERIISGTQRLTDQVNGVLFPLIVDSDTTNRTTRLQQILLQGTRFSLAMVVPISAALFVLAGPLIHAWMGSKASTVAGCIPVIQILALAVAIRVGDATSTTLLKGAGSHRMLAWTNMTTGVVNVALSALLIGPFGLVGVAYGTLMPIAFTATFILFPAACRRVGLTTRYAALHAVFPAVWPAVAAAGVLRALRPMVPDTLVAVLLESAFAGLIYLALFLVAVGRHDRTLYFGKLKEVIGRQPGPLEPKAPIAGAMAGGQ